MRFSTLMDKYLDEAVKPDVQTLLRLKMETPELEEGKRMDRINDYLYQSIEEIELTIDQLPPDEPRSWEGLNSIFLNAVMR